MEYLVTMTTHVPEGTTDATVDEVRAREAAHTRELAARGHVLRLWRPPLAPGDPYLKTRTTRLAPHPSDPAAPGSREPV
jgi:muconolactone delta-isomerase